MELSTSTCIFPAHRQGGRNSLIESIDMCYECGFRHIDLNFCSASNKKSGSELLGDDWETKIDEIGNHAAKLGVVFTQSHAPFDSNLYRTDIPPLTDEYREWYDESVKRSIIASARLGVKWVVTHAQTATTDAEMSREYNLKINREFYSPYLELAKKVGTGIAVENMAEFHPAKTKHRFTATVEEQIAIIDDFADPDIQGAWDFGHAQLVYKDQVPALRKLGHRLKATHVQENCGNNDDHYVPFVRGTTPWEELMPLLKEIDYPGDFTYEIHGIMGKVPDELRIELGKFCYKVGLYLIGLYDKA